MSAKQEAQRLADALEPVSAYGRVGTRDVDQAVVQQAVQLLRQWPEPGEPVAWRHSKTLCLYDTEKDCQLADGDEWAEPLYAAPGAAPSQQPAPARPDEFVCPHCFDEGAAPQAAQSGMVMVPQEATPEMCRAAVVLNNGNAVYKNVAAEALEIEEQIYAEVWEAMVAAAPQAVPQPQPLTDEQLRKLGNKRAIFQAGRDSYQTPAVAYNTDDEAWDEYLRSNGITAKGNGNG